MAPFQKGMQHSVHASEDDTSPSSIVQGDQPSNAPTSTAPAPATWTSPETQQDNGNGRGQSQPPQQDDSWNQVPTPSHQAELQSDEPSYERSRNGDKIYNSTSTSSAQLRPTSTSSMPQKTPATVIQGQAQSSQQQDSTSNTESGTPTPPVDEHNKALPPHLHQPRVRATQSGGMFAAPEPRGVFSFDNSGTYSRRHGVHATHGLSSGTPSQHGSSDAGTNAAQAPMSDKRRDKQRQRGPEEQFGHGNWGAMVAVNGGPVGKSDRAESQAWMETTADNTILSNQGDGQGNGASHSNIDPAPASEPQDPSGHLEPQQSQTLGGSQAAPNPPPPSSVPETYLGLRATVQVLQAELESLPTGEAADREPGAPIPATDAKILSELVQVYDSRAVLEGLLSDVKEALEACRERERRLLEGRGRGGRGREG